MSNYDKNIFDAFLLKWQLHEAVDYLRECPDKADWLSKYIEVFENGLYYKRTDHELLGNIDQIYQHYYRNVFWNKMSRKEAEDFLFHELWQYLGSDELLPKDETIENEIARHVEAEGYHFLGGTTQGYYGPYIWKSSTREAYEVELPSGIQPYTIVMMDGFLSRSWLDFLSFGTIGAGGWAGEDGTLCCVRSSYEKGGKEVFSLSFLKHEAQHVYDQAKYPDMPAVDLEYRAKLVELIYWPDAEKIKSILQEADNSNPNNSHSVAAYRIIHALSPKIFGQAYEEDETAWEKHTKEVKNYAYELLKENNQQYS